MMPELATSWSFVNSRNIDITDTDPIMWRSAKPEARMFTAVCGLYVLQSPLNMKELFSLWVLDLMILIPHTAP